MLRRLIPVLSAAGVAASVGVVGILARPVWHDELFTLEITARPLVEILDALRLDSGPPGHYLLCRMLWLLGGESLVALRLLSVLGATLVAALTVILAARRGSRAAWLAAALIAPHPLLLVVAADARAYALLAATAAAALGVVEGPLDRRRAATLSIVLAVGCWLHSLGLLLVGGCFVASALRPPEERRRGWLAVLAALVLHLPWLPVMAAQPPQALAWMTGALDHAPAATRWALPAIQVSPTADLTPWLDAASPPILVVMMGGAVWLALLLLARRSRPSPRALAAVWATMALIPLGFSLTARPLYFPGRTDVLWLSAAVALVAVGASVGRGPTVLALAVAAAGAVTSIRTLDAWRSSPPGPEHEAATAILRFAAPGDRVVVTGWWFLGVRHAIGSRSESLIWSTFPIEGGNHPGWYDDGSLDLYDAALLRAALVSREDSGRIWLLRTPGLPSDRLLDAVASELGLVLHSDHPPFFALWVSEDAAQPR